LQGRRALPRARTPFQRESAGIPTDLIPPPHAHCGAEESGGLHHDEETQDYRRARSRNPVKDDTNKGNQKLVGDERLSVLLPHKRWTNLGLLGR
jgi:hypothetical protein